MQIAVVEQPPASLDQHLLAITHLNEPAVRDLFRLSCERKTGIGLVQDVWNYVKCLALPQNPVRDLDGDLVTPITSAPILNSVGGFVLVLVPLADPSSTSREVRSGAASVRCSSRTRYS